MATPEGTLGAQLRRWREAGLLGAEQASRIADFERQRWGDVDPAGPVALARPAATSGRAHPTDPGRRTRTAEAVGYVGAALALGAAALILFDLWLELTPGGRATLAGLVTLVTAAAAVALRTAMVPALQRLASVLGAAAVVGVAWTAGVVTADVLDWSGRSAGAAAASAAAVAALPAYLARRRPLPQVVLLLSLVAAVETVLVLESALRTDAFWYALAAVAVCGAWVLGGIGGWLRPTGTATTAGGAVALLALQCGSFGDLRIAALLLGVLIAGAAVAAAVAAGGTQHLAVGAIGLFVLLPQLVIHVFGDAIGAPATLLAIGLLLVVLAVGLGRARREVTEPTEPTSAGGAS